MPLVCPLSKRTVGFVSALLPDLAEFRKSSGFKSRFAAEFCIRRISVSSGKSGGFS